MLGNAVRLTAVLLAASAVAATGADAAKVSPTALFSVPGLNGIQIAIVDAIDRTPRNGTIQAATWAFSDVAVADALIRANAERDVSVEVLVGAQSEDFEAVNRLQAAFDDPAADQPASNVIVSQGPARESAAFPGSTFGAMHQKSWTFSRVGKVPFVSIVTSANVTDNANGEQFNDGYRFVRDKRPYTVLRDLFAQQRVRPRLVPDPFRVVPIGKRRTFTFGPWNTTSAAAPPAIGDPVVDRINALPKRVAIRAGNAAWAGERGVAIAQALAAKKAAGANVKVLHNPVAGTGAENEIGPEVLAVLDAAKIPHQVVSQDPALYLHGKFMIAKYGGQTRVWTGSENWSDDVRASDELVAMVTDRAAFSKFNRWFNTLWARTT